MALIFLSHSLLILTLLSSSFFISPINGFLTESAALKKTEKLSHLHFYFHDIQSGKNPSAVQIISPPNPNKTGSGFFGGTFVIDDALTVGRDPKSKLIGKAQGIYSVAAQKELALLMAINFVFMEGKYNGSTISILGRNPVLNDVRELPIVGGSGLFRFARGYALAHTISFGSKTGDAIVEYNVYVLHY